MATLQPEEDLPLERPSRMTLQSSVRDVKYSLLLKLSQKPSNRTFQMHEVWLRILDSTGSQIVVPLEDEGKPVGEFTSQANPICFLLDSSCDLLLFLRLKYV